MTAMKIPPCRSEMCKMYEHLHDVMMVMLAYKRRTYMCSEKIQGKARQDSSRSNVLKRASALDLGSVGMILSQYVMTIVLPSSTRNSGRIRLITVTTHDDDLVPRSRI